jgi:ubiquinone/menaquinone biosynthesis C-methylase UbiE
LNAPAGLVTDEIEFMRRIVPLDGARVVELGCGKAELSRRLLERGLVKSVAALEVDQRQHALNLASSVPPGLTFLAGGAEAIPLPDAQFDLAIMLKSLHHVPVAQLDTAMAEIRRVLVPGGLLYVSEPVYGGDFLEVVRLFHDEGVVLAAASQAIKRAAAAGVLEHVAEHAFETVVSFSSYDDFVERIVNVTHADRALPGHVAGEVRRRFERHMTPDGARFVRQMRVNVLRRRQDSQGG